MRIRYAIESVLFGILIFVGSVIWKVVGGYIRTKNDVPDILSSYVNTDQLNHTATVSFGEINKMDSIYAVGGAVVISGIYYVTRLLLAKQLRKR
ncbi:hypothetical protein [Cohnella lupini]|uniref:Uncharacterized protein n=1 Tax=Cohnella lupini TaxID=1294267 RepID=A0A3D9IWV2_9BACL|nr:hypothetical protein [Cohnella lupini]RED66185.1 hypothetical protein DFP95_101683 [Cohnella lupini]